MTYPPAEHFLRDLGFVSTVDDHGTVLRSPISSNAMSHGGLRLGVIAVLADMVAAQVALPAVAPDWIATDNLDVHRLDDGGEGTVEVRPTILRIGSKSVVVAVTASEPTGRLLGTGTVGFRRIPGTASVVSRSGVKANNAGFSSPPRPDPPTDLVAACGITPTGPRSATMAVTDYVRNSFGTINGGIQALGFDAVAERAAGQGPAVDLVIRYLRQAKEGPAEFRAEQCGARRQVYDLAVSDQSTGKDLAIGTVTLL